VTSGDLRDQLQTTLGDHYTLEQELGGGGMSRVFVAVDKALHRRVVVKVLPHEMAASVSLERFKREIALAARLQHPHIVPLLSAGATEGLPYFTMPFVEGESLRARLARGGELPVHEGLRVLREVASALDYAHEKGIVHRDIKPDNVLLSRGSAMVSDFGVAKALSASSNDENSGMTSLGVALGTPAYMSPEQAAAAPNIDARADVYAFGIMAYELFAGRPPFHGRSPQAMLAAHVTEPPEPIQKLRPALPAALASLIMRCLEKRPADRPQSAADIVHALDSINTPSGGMQPTGTTPSYRETTPVPAPPPKGPRRTAFIAGGFAAGILAVTALAMTVARRSGKGSDTPAIAAAGASSAKSIAVVPFTGGDPKDEYFGDGVAEELTSMLAHVPDLGVVARSSAFSFKGKPLSSQQIGESLHVSTVLEGTVRRADTRLRITASLINVKSGLTLWSNTYDREPKDVFAVQQEIAQNIAEQLKVTLGANVSHGGTTNLEAHDLYLEALAHSDKQTEPELRGAIDLFEKAIAKDSSFADAWAGLANAWAGLADDWVAPKESYPKAEAAARRALAIDSLSADAHAALAEALGWWHLDFAAARDESRRAVDLKPSSKLALWIYGYMLRSPTPNKDSAAKILARAEQLDPHDAVMAAYRCNVLLDHLDQAEAPCRRAVALDPSSPDAELSLARYYAARKQYDAALRAASLASASPTEMKTELAETYLAAGKKEEARKLALEMIADSKKYYVRLDYPAAIFVEVGDKENAIAALQRAVDDRSASVGTFPFDDPRIKDDPRVKRMAAEVRGRLKAAP
jgi:eukaryotic-like serine/threonine-protein kinase